MAKKAKTESVLSRETRKQAEADALAAAKVAAEKAAIAAKEAAEAAKRAAAPVAKAVRPKKVKKARFVREKAESKPQTKAAPLPARSTKLTGKLMTKNLHELPPKEKGSGNESTYSK